MFLCAICVFWPFLKHLRVFPLISLELGFLLSLSNDYFSCHVVLVWVICSSLPLAPMEIESKLEHAVGASRLCLLPASEHIPSSFQVGSYGNRSTDELRVSGPRCVALLLQLTTPGHGVQRTISRHRIWVSVLLGLPGHRVLSMNGARGGVRRSEGQTVPLPLCLDRYLACLEFKTIVLRVG